MKLDILFDTKNDQGNRSIAKVNSSCVPRVGDHWWYNLFKLLITEVNWCIMDDEVQAFIVCEATTSRAHRSMIDLLKKD